MKAEAIKELLHFAMYFDDSVVSCATIASTAFHVRHPDDNVEW